MYDDRQFVIHIAATFLISGKQQSKIVVMFRTPTPLGLTNKSVTSILYHVL